MKNFWRGAILILLLASTITTFSIFAQEVTPATITGSRLVTDLLNIVAQESGSEQSFIAQPNGTTAGFTVFCTAGAEMTGATRPMSADEEEICSQNGIVYRELLIGYDALAIIAHPELEFLECLTPTNLNALFATSATNNILLWSQTNIVGADETPITMYLPTDDTSLYVLLDNQVNGIRLRDDAIEENDGTKVIEAVQSTEGAIGVVPASIVPQDDSVKILSVQNLTFEGCFAPTPEAIEQGRYFLASPLYVYAMTQSVNKVIEIFDFAFSEAGGATIQSAGYVLPTASSIARNQSIVADETLTGRQFTRDVVAFRIPENIFGSVSIGGNTTLKQYFDALTQDFARNFPAVTATVTLQGQLAGIRNYCADEFDLITVATRVPNQPALNPDQQLGCDNNIGASLTLELGKQAVVLVANAELQQTPASDADYGVCLTFDQVLRVWASNPELPATNWSLVSDNLPDLELLLIAPAPSNLTDLLLTKIDSSPRIVRTDIAEANEDALYRATAVSLVPGLVTYMSWQEYQSTIQGRVENVQLVAVDGGDGCVLPSDETIADMSYPYTLSHQLIIKQQALARSEVQGVIWYLFQDANYNRLASFGVVGDTNLAELREQLQTAFTDAITASLTPLIEPTPEVEATPEVEITPEVETTEEAPPEAESTPEN